MKETKNYHFNEFFVFWGLGVVGFCGLALVVPVYLGAPYAFFNKVLLTYKKKKKKKFKASTLVLNNQWI
jgi:hypothetical protein